MKPNSSLLKKVSVFVFTFVGLHAAVLNTAFAQSGIASPIDPKVTICYQNRTILVAQSTATALVGGGLATLGPCTNAPNTAMCYRGRNISVSPALISSMLSAGATLGVCSPSLVGSGDGKSTAPTVVAGSTSTVGSSVTPSTVPALPNLPAFVTPAIGRPNSPVLLNEVEVCYKGHTLSVIPTAVQTYLAVGGKLGPCSKVSPVKAVADEKQSAEVQK